MELNTSHWTNQSADDFLYRVVFDYVSQLEKQMEAEGITQSELAQRLGVSEGRVSQVLNNPGNLTLKKMIQYARALKRKLAIIEYDDGDPENNNGPVNSEIFVACWRKLGAPKDFFQLDTATALAKRGWR